MTTGRSFSSHLYPIIPFLALLFLFISEDGIADTKYVSDILVINIKSSIEAPFEVVDSVISDEPLQIIRTKDRYYYVETTDGKKGWISKQYVKDTPPKSQIIELLRSENLALAEKLNEEEAKTAQLQTSLDSIPKSSELSQFLEEKEKVEDEAAKLREQVKELLENPNIAAGQELERLKKLHKDLIEEKDELSRELTQLNSKLQKTADDHQQILEEQNTEHNRAAQEIVRLKRKNNLYWFAAGALVFFVGMLTGKISTKKKKKYLY